MRWLIPVLVGGAMACSSTVSDSPPSGAVARDGGGPGAVDAAADAGAISVTDAGMLDALAPDASAPDASAGTGCTGKTYKLCEDFESSPVGATPVGWTELNGYGSNPPRSLVASDAAHGGAHLLETRSSVAGASRVQKPLSGIGAAAGTHWGRVFFKVQLRRVARRFDEAELPLLSRRRGDQARGRPRPTACCVSTTRSSPALRLIARAAAREPGSTRHVRRAAKPCPPRSLPSVSERSSTRPRCRARS